MVTMFGALVTMLMSNLQRVLIAVAVLLGSNAMTGLFAYVKGHNAAAAKCQINSIIRQRDDFKRDRDSAIAASNVLNKSLRELQEKQDAREIKDTENAAALPPIANCVVSDAPKRLRRHRDK